jgi:hypothetical protein
MFVCTGMEMTQEGGILLRTDFRQKLEGLQPQKSNLGRHACGY